MILPSKPEVHSTPMAAGTRNMYKRVRFFLRYHGTVSAATRSTNR